MSSSDANDCIEHLSSATDAGSVADGGTTRTLVATLQQLCDDCDSADADRIATSKLTLRQAASVIARLADENEGLPRFWEEQVAERTRERQQSYVSGYQYGLMYAKVTVADILGPDHTMLPALMAGLSPQMDKHFVAAVASGAPVCVSSNPPVSASDGSSVADGGTTRAHTPGPWFTEPAGAVWSEAIAINYGDPGPHRLGSGTVAYTTRGFGERTQEANAALIAAAPDLLERLQAIVDWADYALANPQEFDSHGVRNLDGPVFDDARAAIAKATVADGALSRHDEDEAQPNGPNP